MPGAASARETIHGGEATRTAGVAEPDVKWSAVAAYRDMMIRHLDD